MGAGILVGLGVNLAGLAGVPLVQAVLLEGVFAVVGGVFVNALKMLVVPLVLFSLIPGIVGIGDIRLLGRVGGKAFGLYLASTALAVATAIVFALGFDIGSGGMPVGVAGEGFSGREAPPLTQVLIDIVPANPIAAMAGGEMLAVIFFAVVFGIGLLAVGREAGELVRVLEQVNAVVLQMVSLVMHFAPYAVFCLIAKAVAELGVGLLVNLAGYVAVLAAALVFHAGVSLTGLLRVLTGLSPIVFLRKVRPAQLFAFSTASSGATIPVTMQCVRERLGVERSVAAFTVPFGATINMDGTAIMQGVATVFIANIYGVDLGLVEYLTVILMAVLASVGTAAVPGVGLVMLTMVFAQVGLPVEGIGLLLGVDRLLDMLRTAVNVTGDAVVSTVVAKGEGKIDLGVYRDPRAGVLGG